MDSRDYWTNRKTELAETLLIEDEAYKKRLEQIYNRELQRMNAELQLWVTRIAKNNRVSYAAALRMLNAAELEDFKMTLEEYIAAGESLNYRPEWAKVLENASARVHISWLDSMKLQLSQHAETIGLILASDYTDRLAEALDLSYYTNLQTLVELAGVGVNLNALNTDEIEIALQRPWAQTGKNFSKAIWENMDALKRELDSVIIGGTIRGEDYNNMADNLARRMKKSRNRAYTLISTERAAMATLGDQKAYKELGVEQYVLIETLDYKTCAECGNLDGRVLPANKIQPGVTAPPFHPRCRGTTAPYIDDEFEREFEREYGRIARDKNGRTVYVYPGMTYNEWKAQRA